jgi:cytochrome c-type biogenesis protein
VSKTLKLIVLLFLAALVVVMVPVCGCGEKHDADEATDGSITITHEDVEKVELLYFHPRFRCLSCNNVEEFAKEVAQDEFSEEMKDGKLEFKSLDIDDPENKNLAEELGVTGSSLYVVVEGDGKREHRAVTDVWLHWNNPEKSKEIITAEINRYLEGDAADGTSRPLAGMPVIIAAFLLGLFTAISPCPLATNIAALSYVSKKLDDRRYTVVAGALYTAGRMVAYTLIGVLLILIGLKASKVSLFFQDYGDKLLGPLLILFGLVMLDVIKFSLFKGRATAAIQERIGDWGLVSSFLLGVLFALAFCPYSAVLFFGMLIPIALESGGGVTFPAIYGLGTGLPVFVFAVALSLGVSELGKHVERIQKFEKYFRWFAGAVFIGVGIYYLVVLIKSFF